MDLAEQARRAYELGRLRTALRLGLFVPLLTALSICGCGSVLGSLVCGGLLAPVVVFFGWKGQGLGRAVLPGVLAGLAPFTIALGAGLSGHACATGGWCTFFIGACLIGGFVAGLFVASAARGSIRQLLAGALLAGLTGSLGCLVAGATGVIALSAGLLLGAVPAFVLRPRTQS